MMKKIVALVALFTFLGSLNAQDNERRFKLSKGTLKICTNAHMKISGYDGDEVIIKSLNKQSGISFHNLSTRNYGLSSDSSVFKSYRFMNSFDDKSELEEGLKPLGNKSNHPEDNLYLDIIENPGELIIRDFNYSIDGVFTTSIFNNKYEVLIPKSIKLLWNTENCAKKNSNTFFVGTNSKPWELANFEGEVEVSAAYNSIKLTDVSGPVIANTIGGNIKVVFDKATPNDLYSLISNDGYIDVTLPSMASINVDASADRILSDINFKILSEDLTSEGKEMHLQLNSGANKMKVDAGTGSIYLRKKK